MARPRVFVSSTYYDLKHIRSSLEIFIESLGYDAVLSEKGDIAFTPDIPLDESCYREAQNSDIYVLIIGGRYGSEISETRGNATRDFFDRYESITKQEYKNAIDKDIPIYILIEKSVYSEYQTFRKNRDSNTVKYAYVDSVNIFHFIEEILGQPRNNPVHTFDRHSEIELWLREQWAGLFRELIQRMSSQQTLASLSAQITTLSEINKTLKRYLEALLTSETPDKSKDLIHSEAKRLEEAAKITLLKQNPLVAALMEYPGVDFEKILKALKKSPSYQEFLDNLVRDVTSAEGVRIYNSGIYDGRDEYFYAARDILSLASYPNKSLEKETTSSKNKKGSSSKKEKT